MDPDIIAKLAAFFEPYPVRHIKKGQILVHLGDDPECVFSLLSGKVKQYDLTYRGDEVVVNVFKPPAFFPMSFALNRTPNEYFFEAETDVELRKVPIDEMTAFIRTNPDVLYDLLGRVYRGTDGLLRRMAHLMSSTAKRRVIFELVIECRRFGDTASGSCVIGLSESDIGARAGLSRETVNREMSKLKAEGLIKMVNKQIIIPDLAYLEQALGKEL